MIHIRKAQMEDVREIHALLTYFSDRRELLPRSLSEIYENLPSYFVALHKKRLIGCCALYVTWAGLAEVKALAVSPTYQGKGIGKRLLKATLGEAKKLGVEKLFTLTIRDRFFKKYGFKKTKKNVGLCRFQLA